MKRILNILFIILMMQANSFAQSWSNINISIGSPILQEMVSYFISPSTEKAEKTKNPTSVFHRTPYKNNFATSITLNILENGDDAEENITSGVVDRWSSDLELTNDNANSMNQIIGLRYENVNIPQGSTIDNAYIEFECDEPTTEATSITFWMEDVDDAANLTSNNFDISSRTKTTSSVAWSSIPSWNTAGQLHSSPELKNIIQEVVDRSGWTSGNDITVLIEGSGSRVAEAYGSDGLGAPILHITYSDPPPTETCYAIGQGNNGQLYSWTPTGSQSLIGTVGVLELETMTLDGACNTIHAIDGNVYGTVNSSTGNFTSSYTLTSMEANGVIENITDVDGLAIDDNTGYLWAIERKVPGNDLLFQINPETGKVVEDIFGVGIDYVELVGAQVDVDDIAFNPCTGVLYGVSTISSNTTVDQIVTINTSTGALTVVATLANCDIEGLTFNNSCDLFASTGYQDCVTPNSIFSIDVANQTSTLVTTFSTTDVEAVVCCVTAPVPTCDNFNNAGSIGHDETICIGDDVFEIQNVSFPTGGVGATEVVWMYSTSTTTPPSGTSDSNWNIIAGANELTYDPGVINVNTSYARLVKRDNCTSYLVSNVVTMTVQSCGTCTTITSQVNASYDDAEEDLATGTVDVWSSDLELAEDIPNNLNQLIGMRFTNLSIPQGATISSAYIEFDVDEISSSPTTLTFWAEDIDDAPTFGYDAYHLSSRTKTSASTGWNNIPAWTSTNDDHNTPNLNTLVQEVVDRSGWSSGNDLVIFLEGTGSRIAESWNGENASAPKIFVTYCIDACNALANNEYDNGTNDWWIYSQSGNSASFTIDNTNQLSGANSAYIDITQASGTGWHIEFAQEPLTLTNGDIYDISFEAKAVAARDIYVTLQLRESPWTEYWSQTVPITTSGQTYSFTGIDPGVTNSNIGFMFKFGQSSANVWVDNVFLSGSCDCDDLTSAGQIGSNDSGCDPYNPPEIQDLQTPSGGSGAIEYIWMETTSSCSTPPTGSTDPNWNIISGATSATYNPSPISVKTCYARLARRAGCTNYLVSNIVTMDVSVNLDLSLVSSSNISCHKGHNGEFTVQGTGGVPPYEYKTNGFDWSTNNTFTGLYNGTYQVDVRDATGCVAWNAIDVDISEPEYHLYCNITEVNHASCDGASNGNFTVLGDGGTAPYTYSIDNGPFVSGGLFTGLAAGSYTVTVKDANDCTYVCSTAVIENQIAVCYPGEIEETTLTCPSNDLGVIGSIEDPYSICNIIKNHEFDTNEEWDIWANVGSSATFSYDNTGQLSGANSAYVDITSTSGTDWHIVLFQRSLELVAGTQYEIRVDAKGEANKTINISLQQDQAPNTTYYSESFTITTTGETYVLPSFTAPVNDNDVKIMIRVGDSSDNLWIDKVVMGVKDTGATPNYQWQSRVDNGAGGWTSWTDISGATSATYDPPVATDNTQYRRNSNVAICNTWQSSNVIDVPICPTYDLTGRVFEDINYGGGEGRSYSESNTSAQSSGWSNNEIGVANAIVELYDNAGNYISNTTTDASGNYTFTALGDGNYQVRVVNGSFDSNRGSNSTGETIIPVQTFRSTNTQNFISEIGGADPSLIDASANTSSSTLSSLTAGSNIAQSVTSISVAGSNVDGVDFGYNFNTIVNTNDSGQGSVRQFILNSNELENDNLDQEDAPTNGVSFPKDLESETSIFMIPGSGVHTINPLSGFDAIEDPQTHLTGYTQQGSAQGPIASRTITVELEGNTVLYDGVSILSSDVQVSGLSIHSFRKGIRSYKTNTTNNFIWGNYIGTKSNGTTTGTNASAGIELNNVNDSYIGTNADNVNDANEGNLASDSYGGIEIKSTTGILVAGNYVGTDKNGTGDLGNTFIGIHIINADGPNVIGFDDDALSTNAVHMRNVTSGNGTDGIRLSGGDNQVIAGNYAGTDLTGTLSIPNGGYGVQMITNIDNLILGTDSDGDDDIKERNIISGNNAGIRFVGYGVGDGNRVSGNFIGTDVTGNTALQNDNNGIDISGDWTNLVIGTNGDNVNDGIEGNVISGNDEDGIRLADTDGALIAGNNIGLGYNGTTNVGNGKRGILIAGSAANNIIGYSSTLTNQDELVIGNNIQYNDDAGIGLSGNGTQNRLSRNQIANNSALGIDLDYDLVTANDNGDTDSGPNDLLNFPVLESATIIGSNYVISGFAPANAEIEFFLTDGGTNPNPRPSDYTKDFGEGAEYLFTAYEGGASDSDATVATYTDDGTGSTTTKTQNKFEISIPTSSLNLIEGVQITATATNSNNSTSEFSGWTTFFTCDPNLACEIVGDVTNVSCHKGHNGAFTVQGTGGTPPYQYSLNGGAYSSNNSWTDLINGTYYVTVKDANDCYAIDCTIVNITEPAWYLGCSQVGKTNHISCGGSNDGSFTVLGNNGTPPYTYSLNGGAFVTSGTFTGLASGTYDVTVKDANDCTVDCQSIIVSQPTTVCYPGEIDDPTFACPANDPGTIGNLESPYTICNMLFNSEFDDGDNLWALYVEGSNTASLSIDNTSQLSGANSAYVDITSTTGTYWHIQLYQNPLTLVNGTQYELSFEAKSVAPRTVRAVLELGEAPWTEYWTETINLTNTAQTFNFSGIDPGVNMSNVTFYIKGGESSENFWIDNFVLGEKTTSSSVSYQWQKREDDGAGGWTPWTDISGATSSTYDPSIPSILTQIRRRSNITDCGTWQHSNVIDLTPLPTIEAGDDVTICEGQNTILVATATNTNGTVTYSWDNSLGNGASHTVSPTVTTSYTVTVDDDAECSATDVVTVNVINNFDDAGLISGDESGCESYDPTIITSSTLPSGGNGGSFIYSWQERIYNCSTDTYGTWTDIASATDETYDPPVINESVEYRRRARRDDCFDWVNGNVVTKEVVDEYTAGGNIEGDETQCGAFDPALITNLTDPSGGCGGIEYIRWYKWEMDCATGNWITPGTAISGANDLTYDPPSITVSTRYRRYARRSATCPGTNGVWVISNFVYKTVVDNISDLGAIDGAEVMCGSYDPTPITITTLPSGGCGADIEYRWYERTQDCSTGDWDDWVLLANTNTSTYDPSTITQTTQYAYHTRRGDCAWVPGLSVIKTVNENFTDGGDIDGNESICGSYDPSLITSLSEPSGGCGTAWGLWQKREFNCATGSFGSWSNIDNTTNLLEYDPTTITTTTEYRRLWVKSECNPDYVFSDTITKEVIIPDTDGGTITGAESFCGGYDPTEITSVTLPTGGCGGELEYFWGYRTIDCATGTASAWTNFWAGESYDPGPITQTTEYWRRARRIAGCTPGWLYSNKILKEVVENYDDPGTVQGDETLCGSYDPAMITSITDPSGGCGGSLEIRWYKWEQDCATGTWGSGVLVSGANDLFYDPPTISISTRYRRYARRTGCTGSPNWMKSNFIHKYITEDITTIGTITGAEEFCGGFDPAVITFSTPTSGGCNGDLEYRWWKQTRDCATGDWNAWELITSGIDMDSYDPDPITVTTHYAFHVRRGDCDWQYGNGVIKTVHEDISDPGTISSDESNCGSFDPSTITGTDATGGCFTQTTQYIWQYREGTSGAFINISGTNSTDYDPPAITTTTQYRRAVRYINCPWAYSNIVTKTVFDQPTVTLSLGDTEVCDNEGIINLTGGSPANGTYSGPGVSGSTFDPSIAGVDVHSIVYNFTDVNGCSDSATDDIEVFTSPIAAAGSDQEICEGQSVQLNGSGGNIFLWSPATGLSDPNIANPIASPNTTTTYTLTTTNADGCQDTDDIVVTVSPIATVTVNSDQTICDNTTASLSSNVIGGTGTVNYQWQKSVNGGNNWTDISGATSSSYTTANLQATTYFRLNTTWPQSACTEQASNMVTITVDLSSVVANIVATKDTLCGGESTVLTVNDGIQNGGLIDYSNWALGQGSAAGYNKIGATNENNRINDNDPWGHSEIVWETGNDIESNADGGWNSSTFPIDHTKTYRYSVWINRKIIGANGRAYLGVYGYGATNGVKRISNNTSLTNAYFWYSNTPPTTFGEDEWILVVGHVFPSNHTGTTLHTDSGKYTLCEGKIGNTIADYKWLPESTTSLHRNYLYYSTDTDVRQQFIYPRVDVLDGNEPSIDDLLNGLDQTKGLGAGASYEWYTGSCGGTLVGTGPTLPVTPTVTTTYYVRAIGTCNTTSCESIEIVVGDVVASADNDGPITCAEPTVQLSATPTGLNYDWSGPNNFNSNIENPEAVEAGIYTVTVTDDVGCSDIATTEVTEDITPPTAIAGDDQAICDGEVPITIGAASESGLTYQWSIAGTDSIGATASTLDVSPTVTTVYTLTTTALNGCIGTDDVTVTVNTLPSVSLNLNNAIVCTDDASFALSGGSPANGSYSGPGVTGSTFDPAVSGVGAHKITYTYTDVNGCGGEAHQMLIVNALPEITLDNETICSGDTLTLDPLVCEPYVDIVAQRPLLAEGWVNVFGVGGTGITGDGELCFTLDEANLTSANMIGLNTDPHSSNNYASIDFAIYVLVRHGHANPYLMQIREDGVSQANPYNSTTSYVGSTFCIRRTGTTIEYLLDGVVKYTSTKSSTGTLYYDHSIHSGEGIYTGGYSKFTDISLCGDVDYNYSWNTGDTSDTLDVHEANTYSVQITDSNGCSESAQATININTITNPSATVEGPITCENTSVQLTALPADLIYTWNGPGSYVSSSRTPTVSIPGTYDLTIHDFNTGCYEYLSVDVLLESQGAITAVNAGCENEDISIDYTIDGSETQAWIGLYEVAGANANFLEWSWVPTIPGSGTVTFSDHSLTGGTYEARLYSTGGYILCESEQFTLDATPDIVLSSDGGFTCEDTDVQLTAMPIDLIYLWNGPGSFVSSSGTPTVNDPGMYVVTVTDPATSCQSVDSIEVFLQSAGSIDQIQSSCNYDVITVDYTIAGNETQAWIGIYDPAANDNNFLVWSWVPTIPGSDKVEFTGHDLAPGNYEARLFSTAGYVLCESEGFTFGQEPECLITGRTLVEENTQNEIYSAAPNMTYAWSVISGDANIDGTTNGQNVTLDFGTANSTLQLIITSPEGCSATCTIDIEMSPAGQCSFRDEFILQAFNNTDGTEDWANNSWVEIGDDNDPIGGDIVFVSQKLRLDNDDSSLPAIERDLDLSTIANAVLSFNYNQGSGDLESNDIVEVHVFDGTSWHVVLSDSGNIPPNSSPVIDISMYANAGSKIKISIASGYADAAEYVFFDNIMVTGDCIVPEICDDGIDNDFDGLRDCEDPDCSAFVDCVCQTIITNRHIYYKTRTTP